MQTLNKRKKKKKRESHRDRDNDVAIEGGRESPLKNYNQAGLWGVGRGAVEQRT